MVGVPRSIGCETCRKRKKKCDNRAPACTACVASGRICPGYQKKYKFINENASLLAHYRKKKYLLEEIGADLDETVALSRSSGNHNYSTIRSYEWISWPLISSQDHDGANLVYILQDSTSQMVFPLSSHGGFYQYIPGRLGRNLALDSAVACLCTVYADLLAADGTISKDAWRKYAQSLEALRLCLDDPGRCFQSETICASIVLQLCELLTNADNGRWNQLSHGTKALIQNCDIGRFRQPFERTMLESQRAFFIVQDMNLRQPCFLAQSPWREFLRETEETALTPASRACVLRSKLCDWLVDVPVLLEEVSGTLHSGHCGMKLERLVKRAMVIHDQIEGWYLAEVVPAVPYVQQRGDNGAPLRPSAEYSQPLMGVLDCVTNSTLITLEDAISTSVSLLSESDGFHKPIDFSITISKRQQTINNALEYVRGYSLVAAKPLEFGLHQLRSLREG
ncbi:GAL4-like ZnII2Cys6 or C6 zinc binuclear cluster DNA-binding domain protein [Aspergillus parasiticus SU-1]|uniref:GAL4-like ZnII2Cys6 or C6 zinc binuclear cluster DNA-binding domain protein n=1 Tax=Aspergillus parasiticus (strain ATCC 56775 / NRRL 5862 / SRRC 143 / SU-1) TaxID=1403190 RepID=A0A0F0ID86_ASPPU|nr:GAL4-like ZnII2Cys6 or C6 zinc binuclear cluster DNA-binding domain protein [Aspergillus parasiticus SU-1]